MKILVPIDGSKSSDAAVEMVIEQARSRDDEIRVLHVIEPPSLLVAREMGGYDPALDEIWESERKRAQQLVADAAERMQAKGLTVSTAVESGHTQSVILDFAADWPADLIVLGSHGRKGLDRFLMGSVSEAVARHARCSVEIARAAAGPLSA